MTAILLGAMAAIVPSIITMLPERMMWGDVSFASVSLNPIATIFGVIAALPAGAAKGAINVVVADWQKFDERTWTLQVTDVLEVALGVRVGGVEPPWLQQLALDHVDRLTEEMRRRTLPTVVDRRLLIDACVGEQVRSRAPAELLAGWVREPPRWGVRGASAPGRTPPPRASFRSYVTVLLPPTRPNRPSPWAGLMPACCGSRLRVRGRAAGFRR
jgi:hypothetical protein